MNSFEKFKKDIDFKNTVLSEQICKVLFISTLFDDKWKTIFNESIEGGLPEKVCDKVNQYVKKSQQEEDDADKWKCIHSFINELDHLKSNQVNNISSLFPEHSGNQINEFSKNLIDSSVNEQQKNSIKSNLTIANLCFLYLGHATEVYNKAYHENIYDEDRTEFKDLVNETLCKLKHSHKEHLIKTLKGKKTSVDDNIKGVISILRQLTQI
jgi:hypothetical protein